jgi:hypothetical protein
LKCEVSSSTAPAVTIPTNKANWQGQAGDRRLEATAGVMCETKPNLERMGYLGKRSLRAERFGDVAESARQSRLPKCEQDHRQASLDAATRTVARDGAEQSQFQADTSWRTKPIAAEASSLKCEVSSSTPAGGGDPSRGRLGYMAPDPSCETKPIGEGGFRFEV